jgi:DNA-binding NtrC family response regulator
VPAPVVILGEGPSMRAIRVGAHGLIEVDARMIAATNRNLERQVAVGEFREDLYYRLSVVELRIPPLRDRREEIPGLTGRPKQLAPETLVRLTEHSWSGNVRELENAIRRMVAPRRRRAGLRSARRSAPARRAF